VHCEFVAFLEEIQNEYGEIIYHTNVRWLIWGSGLKQFFYLLNEIKYSGKRKAEILKN
jgi:hypothetical protein